LLALVTFASVNAALIRLRFSHPETKRSFRVPMPLRRVPLPTALGLVVVVVLLTQFAPLVYGIAGAALVLAFIMQAVPWNQTLMSGGPRP
jgi:amino acid transporter